jgi:TonB family protein
MAESPEPIQNFSPNADRRIHARHRLRSLAYVELGENNGGIVLNIGEGGFAVRAAEAITEDRLPNVRFQTQNSEKQLVASSEIAWASDSRKEAGMRFVDLPEEALAEIKIWISQEDSPLHLRKPTMSVARQSFRTTTAAREPFSGTVPDDPADRVPERGIAETYLSKSSLFREPKAPSSSSEPSAAESEKPRVNWMDFRVHLGPGWVLVASMVFLASLSFAAGMAVRRGDLGVFSRSSQDKSPEHSAPNQETVPHATPSGAAAKPWNIEIVDSSNRRWNIPGKSPAVPASQHSDGLPAPGLETGSAILPPATPPNATGKAPDGEKKPPVVLSLPETSLAASGNVAISSQRSFRVPTDSSTEASQPGKNLHVGQLVNLVEPVYPPDAEKNHIEGTVKLHATIGADGSIKDLQPLNGPPSLFPAALTAVRQWRYNPTLLNGRPIETQEDISLVFRLPK